MAQKGYDLQYGARPLKRTIQSYLEDKLAETILSDKFKKGDVLITSFDSENDTINITLKQ